MSEQTKEVKEVKEVDKKMSEKNNQLNILNELEMRYRESVESIYKLEKNQLELLKKILPKQIIFYKSIVDDLRNEIKKLKAQQSVE